MTDRPGDYLIDGYARVNFGGAFLHANASEKGAIGTRVVPCPIHARSGVAMVQATENLKVLANGCERLHRAIEFEVCFAAAFRPPNRWNRAIREIQKDRTQRNTRGGGGQSARGFCCLLREQPGRDERFKSGKRDASPKTAEERAAVECQGGLRRSEIREALIHGWML